MSSIKISYKKLIGNPLYIYTALLCFTLIFITSYYNIDPDFGWHLASGKYILTNGIPKLDIFSYTAANFPWINHEWLNDIFLAWIYGLGGYLLTAIVFSSIWLAGLITAQRLRLKFVLLLSTLTILPFSGIRPVVWTVLLLAILERLIFSKSSKIKYLIPILFVFWANMHGSFVFGLAVLGLYQIFSKHKIPWPAFLLSFVAVLINPYGPKIFEEIIRTAQDSQLRYRIGEWRPFLLPLISIPYIILITALNFAVNKKPLKKIVSIPGLTLLMAISSIRHLPVFVASSSRYLEDLILNLKKSLRKSKLDRSRRFVIGLGLTLMWLPIVVLSIMQINASFRKVPYYPDKAIDYLRQKPCGGNIFNSYNFGGYLIWKLPEAKVYIDGRMPSWKFDGQDYFGNWSEFIKNDESRKIQSNKYNIKCILLSKDQMYFTENNQANLFDRLTKEGWQYINEGSTTEYYLFQKP